jgi:hypothetical protein
MIFDSRRAEWEGSERWERCWEVGHVMRWWVESGGFEFWGVIVLLWSNGEDLRDLRGYLLQMPKSSTAFLSIRLWICVRL